MKTLLAFFALSLAAIAQTLIGPNTGPVFLKGDPGNPSLVNHSGKVVLLAVFLTHASNGFEQVNHVFFGSDPTGAKLVKDGEERRGLRAAVAGTRVTVDGVAQTSAIVSTELDLVIFTDGEMVGPDKFKSEQTSLARIKQSTHSAISLWRAKQ